MNSSNIGNASQLFSHLVEAILIYIFKLYFIAVPIMKTTTKSFIKLLLRNMYLAVFGLLLASFVVLDRENISPQKFLPLK